MNKPNNPLQSLTHCKICGSLISRRWYAYGIVNNHKFILAYYCKYDAEVISHWLKNPEGSIHYLF